MKTRNLSIAALAMFCAASAHAASSIQLEVGVFRNASNVTVTSGTWALILNTGTPTTLPGGIAVGTGQDHLTSLDFDLIASAFTGIALTPGEMVGEDTIVSVGNINNDLGDGVADALVNFTSGQEELAYAIYWFPGLAVDAVIPTSFQVGGLFEPAISIFAPIGMYSPPALTTGQPAVFVDMTSLAAVAVPEPASLTLSALGLAALLRRRRA